MDHKSSRVTRVVSNALIGSIAGALPAIAWYAWIEWTAGLRDGLGGLAWMAALGAGVLMGGLTGAGLGTFGRGARVVGAGSVTLALVGACGGAMLGAAVGQLAVGLGDEQAVAIVLIAEAMGIAAGMLLLTSPRTAKPAAAPNCSGR